MKPGRRFKFFTLTGLGGIAVAAAMLGFSVIAAGQTPASVTPPAALQVLIFWDRSCALCKPVLKDLEKVRNKYPEVQFFAVTSGSESAARAELNKQGLSHYAVHDHGDALIERYQVDAIPRVLITDSSGKVLSSQSQFTLGPPVSAYVDMELYFRRQAAVSRQAETRAAGTLSEK